MPHINEKKTPFELNDEIIYLNPNSAEGKAIKRLEDINAGEEVKWVTDIEEKVDETELDKKIRDSGYLI